MIFSGFKLHRYTILLGLVWTFLLSSLFVWNIKTIDKNSLNMGLDEARSLCRKDLLYRTWNTQHGGIYAPVSPENPPNPYLKVLNRDLETRSGMRLTLISPAYMTRQVFDLGTKHFGIRERLVSLNPIRPENKADSWEEKALKSMESGPNEHWKVVELKGKTYLRYITGLRARKTCLGCHKNHKVGDLLGGISIYVPMGHIVSISSVQKRNAAITYFIITIAGLMAIIVMFSRIKSREETLERSEARYRELFENSAVGIFRVDPKGKFLDVNPKLARMFGCKSPEELKSLDVARDLGMTQKDKARFVINMKKSEVKGLEFKLKKKDGSPIWVSVFGNVKKNVGGSTDYYHGMVLDITDKKLAEKALKEISEKYGELFERTAAGVFQMDRDGRFVTANPSLLKILGYSSVEELKNAGFHIWNKDELSNFLREVKKRGKLEGYAAKVRRSDGKPVWLKFYAYSSCDGSIIEGTCIDATREKVLEEQLRHSQKMEALGTLAGGVAHEFNNILTGIKGSLELLTLYLGSENEKVKNKLQTMERSVERAVKLVGQILTFSRRKHLERKVVNINNEISRISDTLSKILGEDVELELSLSEEIYPAKIDPDSLENIMLNLASNARDAMPDGGKLTIKTKNVDPKNDENLGRILDETQSKEAKFYVLISVTDSGCGMKKEVLERIFEPFFTTKEAGKGTGLGLSIVYGLVKDQGGFIFADSEPGKGSRFDIYFPAGIDAITEEDREESEVKATEVEKEKKKAKVLLVEDDTTVREILTEMLTVIGYDVTTSENGMDGLTKYKNMKSKPDIVITDLVMPRMGGLELYERIRQEGGNCSFVFISGYNDKIINGRNIPEGSKLIKKPFTLVELKRAISLIKENQISRKRQKSVAEDFGKPA